MAETVAEYEEEKATLDELVDELAEEKKELAERADTIDDEIDKLEKLRREAEAAAAPSEPDPGNAGDCPASNPGGGAGAAITFACAQIGKPYAWGSAGPGSYDCSGLTLSAWREGGVTLPHNAAQQRDAVPYVERGSLRPGDLVFYYSGLSHVGLYAGAGMIVHASQAGVPVKMSPIDQMPIHSYGRAG